MLRCGSGLSDLSKGPLLHILQLVFPLEPEEGGRNARFKIKIHQGSGLQAFVETLLGSFSGFNQVPLLQTLEAICENTALWLQRHATATGQQRHADAQFPPKL